ncbi:hypothetical protein DMN91_001263 [Ooceraea biroi]|uniref:Uncharacterized protein n=1 Tax=Ooceraea biroi TaxID=2015173 RepID=A0A3L8E5Y1_OOCBI|nr:hypothetical protein DMN91_001263 [Ooceraea biroi]
MFAFSLLQVDFVMPITRESYTSPAYPGAAPRADNSYPSVLIPGGACVSSEIKWYPYTVAVSRLGSDSHRSRISDYYLGPVISAGQLDCPRRSAQYQAVAPAPLYCFADHNFPREGESTSPDIDTQTCREGEGVTP